MRRSNGEVIEGGGITRQHGNYMERRIDENIRNSGQEWCREESSVTSTGKADGRDSTAETGLSREKARGGSREEWERASATTFWEPGRWMRSLVNLNKQDRCLCCLADQGGETLNRA